MSINLIKTPNATAASNRKRNQKTNNTSNNQPSATNNKPAPKKAPPKNKPNTNNTSPPPNYKYLTIYNAKLYTYGTLNIVFGYNYNVANDYYHCYLFFVKDVNDVLLAEDALYVNIDNVFKKISCDEPTHWGGGEIQAWENVFSDFNLGQTYTYKIPIQKITIKFL